MNTTKINSLVSIMEFCDIHSLFQMKFLNKRNNKFSILKTTHLKIISNILNNINFINFEDKIFDFFFKNGIKDIYWLKITLSYLIVKKLKIINEKNQAEKKYEKIILSNFNKNEYGIIII